MISENEAYQDLANAIIKQAVIDYKRASKQLEKRKSRRKDKNALIEKNDCERFFFSNLYASYTTVDPKYLVEQVNKSMAEEKCKKLKRRLMKKYEIKSL